jgi:hypothetical protein
LKKLLLDEQRMGVLRKMTRHEAVQAYLAGGIDRREFVRRLTIAGVSTAAALTYAQSLTSSASAAPASRGANGIAQFQDAVYDDDDDGLTNDEEEELGTDPDDPDSDDDGINDGDEVDNGTDPLDANDPGDDDDDDDDDDGGSPTLPNTGTGGTESRTGLIGALAAAGAGAAILGRKLRRADAEI